MSEEINDLTEIENRLQRLLPAAHQIDRDALMFRAGGAAGQRPARRALCYWQGACALLVLAIAGMGEIAFFARESVHVAQVIVHEPRLESPPPGLADGAAPVDARPAAPPPADAGYLRLRHDVLAAGLGALDRAAHTGTNRDQRNASPPLRGGDTGDGWDALPAWQRQASFYGGGRS